MDIVEFSPSADARLENWLDIKKHKKTKQDIDLRHVYAMGACMLDKKDIATRLGISRQSLEKWLENWPEFAQALQQGYASCRDALSKKQVEVAMSGNAGMLIWLGKQYMRQADKLQTETKSEVSVIVQNAMSELQSIDKSQLLEARAVLRAGTVVHEAEGE